MSVQEELNADQPRLIQDPPVWDYAIKAWVYPPLRVRTAEDDAKAQALREENLRRSAKGTIS